MKKNNFLILVIIFIVALFLSGCAKSVHYMDLVNNSSINNSIVYGFYGGLWHGMIIIFSFIGSLFNNNIVIYAINNNGNWYDFGFILGISAVINSSSTIVIKRIRK